jgi:hypothetical protein
LHKSANSLEGRGVNELFSTPENVRPLARGVRVRCSGRSDLWTPTEEKTAPFMVAPFMVMQSISA